MSFTYSFLDTQAAIVGPGGSFSFGAGAGNSEEGISITQVSEFDEMTIGADGSGMHSLIADKSAKISVSLLKTSPTNALFAEMAALQRTSGALHGQNTITIVNMGSGDVITAQQVAFAKIPDIKYAKSGGMNVWELNAIITDVELGAGLDL